MDIEGGGVEGFQDPICTASQYFGFRSPPLYSNPLLSPLPLSPSPHNVQHMISSGAKYSLISVVLLDSTIEREGTVKMPYGHVLWTAEFATSVAGRGGMLGVMIPGGECSRFASLVLNAYKGRYLRRRRFRTCPPPLNA